MSRRGGVFLVVLLLGLMPVGSARADGAAAASETARALFNEGLSLRARGDLDGALAKLRAAHALRATPVTAFELARASIDHRDLVEARDLLLSIKRMPAGANESRDAQKARKDAGPLAEELKRRIPTLTIVLTGPGAASKPNVVIDEVPIPQEALTEPQRVNPKRHHVVARVEGANEVAADVELREAENGRVTLDLPAPVPASSPQPEEKIGPRDTTLPKVLTYGGFSLAFAGVVVGTVAGVRSLDQVSQLKSACNEHRICAPDQAKSIDSAKTSGNVATTSFIIAGVGAALGAVGLLLWPRTEPPRSARAALVVRPTTFGVEGTFR